MYKLDAKDVELVSGFDVEEIHVAVDVVYYFDHRSKRKVSYTRVCTVLQHRIHVSKLLKCISTNRL